MVKEKKSAFPVQPLADRVVILPLDSDEREKKSAAGIIIPSTTDAEKADRGKVVAIGEGRIDSKGNLVPMSVKVGDKVVFQWGEKIKLEGDDTEYFIVSESNVLAVIK